MKIRVKAGEEFQKTMKKIREEGKVINYIEDRYTYDREGFLVKIEKEIDYR